MSTDPHQIYLFTITIAVGK